MPLEETIVVDGVEDLFYGAIGIQRHTEEECSLWKKPSYDPIKRVVSIILENGKTVDIDYSTLDLFPALLARYLPCERNQFLEIIRRNTNPKCQASLMLATTALQPYSFDNPTDGVFGSFKDYKIYLSGEIMLEKWVKEIGFSNLATITKYDLWKKLGFYIPKITFEERKKLLKAIN